MGFAQKRPFEIPEKLRYKAAKTEGNAGERAWQPMTFSEPDWTR